MFKVLDIYGNKIKVDSIDTKIHRHLSGRNFTEQEVPKKVAPKIEKKEEIKKENKVEKVEKKGIIKKRK